MARVEKVPDIVVGRLPVYLRALDRLTSEGQEVISSQDLARLLGVSSAQIRKDLSHFGEFGKQGTGYRTAYLQEQLSAILQVDREWEVALVGSGPLAEALVLENTLAGKGCRVAAVFDTRPERVGMRLGDLEICGRPNASGAGQRTGHEDGHTGLACGGCTGDRRRPGQGRHPGHPELHCHNTAGATGSSGCITSTPRPSCSAWLTTSSTPSRARPLCRIGRRHLQVKQRRSMSRHSDETRRSRLTTGTVVDQVRRTSEVRRTFASPR